MNTTTALRAARAYRRAHAAPIATRGVVLVWEGRGYGWKDILRDPSHECPGALAIDVDGRIWQAVGGNDRDGAREWQPVTPGQRGAP